MATKHRRKCMKKVTHWLAISLLIVLITSCGTLFTKGGSDYRDGVSSYENKQYAASLASLQLALIANPEFEEAITLFPIVFNEGTAYYKDIISTNKVAQTVDATENVFLAYSDMQKMHRTAKNSGRKGLAAEEFAAEVEAARIKSADVRFTYAKSLEARGDRVNFKAAVLQYEQVKERAPEYPDIERIIKDVTEKATVSIMVFTEGTSTGLHAKIFNTIKSNLGATRFLKIVESEDFSQGTIQSTNFARALDWGKRNNIDYVISVKDTSAIAKTAKTKNRFVPESDAWFSAEETTYGYYYYTKLDYSIFNINTSAVEKSGAVEAKTDNIDFTISLVKATGHKELNLGDTGKRTLNYYEIDTDLGHERLGTMIYEIETDSSRVYSTESIANPNSSTDWFAYYKTKYSDLASLVRGESGKVFFYNVHVIAQTFNNPATYIVLGTDVFDSIKISARNKAMSEALLRVAKEYYTNELNSQSNDSLKPASDLLAKDLKAFF